jgi:hypothetical protein
MLILNLEKQCENMDTLMKVMGGTAEGPSDLFMLNTMKFVLMLSFLLF